MKNKKKKVSFMKELEESISLKMEKYYTDLDVSTMLYGDDAFKSKDRVIVNDGTDGQGIVYCIRNTKKLSKATKDGISHLA